MFNQNEFSCSTADCKHNFVQYLQLNDICAIDLDKNTVDVLFLDTNGTPSPYRDSIHHIHVSIFVIFGHTRTYQGIVILLSELSQCVFQPFTKLSAYSTHQKADFIGALWLKMTFDATHIATLLCWRSWAVFGAMAFILTV